MEYTHTTRYISYKLYQTTDTSHITRTVKRHIREIPKGSHIQ